MLLQAESQGGIIPFRGRVAPLMCGGNLTGWVGRGKSIHGPKNWLFAFRCGDTVRAKRVVSLFVGTLAAFAGIVFLGAASLLIGDLRNPGIPKLPSAIAEFVVLSLAGLSWFEAYRFLKYFFIGPSQNLNGSFWASLQSTFCCECGREWTHRFPGRG